jgi:hypothetical protein
LVEHLGENGLARLTNADLAGNHDGVEERGQPGLVDLQALQIRWAIRDQADPIPTG